MMKLVVSTAPAKEAPVLARAVVEERLAACVNVLDGARSVYAWDGEVREDPESVLLIKTTAARVGALRERLMELHSYDVPEIIVIDVRDDESSAAYRAWLEAYVGR